MSKKTVTNLIEEVTHLLRRIPNGKQATEIMLNDRNIISANNKNIDVQRIVLNNFWSLQLFKIGSESDSARASLIPNGTYNEWLRLFERDALPLIIQHNLPRV